MKHITKNSSIIVLAFGVLFLLADLFVPQSATALSRAEKVGNSWGGGCWKESGSIGKNTDRCNTDLTCRSCCDRKRDSCKRKYPNSKSKCQNYWTFCMDRQRKPTSIPGGTGFQAPSGRIKQTPRSSRFSSRFRLQRFFQFGGIRSRGIDNLPPPVNPDPEPPALPNFELQGEKT